MTTTREVLVKSWHAARRQAHSAGGVVLNAASFAGYALEAGGTVARARALVPSGDESPFWARVSSCLDHVATEEMGLVDGTETLSFVEECL